MIIAKYKTSILDHDEQKSVINFLLHQSNCKKTSDGSSLHVSLMMKADV